MPAAVTPITERREAHCTTLPTKTNYPLHYPLHYALATQDLAQVQDLLCWDDPQSTQTFDPSYLAKHFSTQQDNHGNTLWCLAAQHCTTPELQCIFSLMQNRGIAPDSTKDHPLLVAARNKNILALVTLCKLFPEAMDCDDENGAFYTELKKQSIDRTLVEALIEDLDNSQDDTRSLDYLWNPASCGVEDLNNEEIHALNKEVNKLNTMWTEHLTLFFFTNILTETNDNKPPETLKALFIKHLVLSIKNLLTNEDKDNKVTVLKKLLCFNEGTKLCNTAIDAYHANWETWVAALDKQLLDAIENKNLRSVNCLLPLLRRCIHKFNQQELKQFHERDGLNETLELKNPMETALTRAIQSSTAILERLLQESNNPKQATRQFVYESPCDIGKSLLLLQYSDLSTLRTLCWGAMLLCAIPILPVLSIYAWLTAAKDELSLCTIYYNFLWSPFFENRSGGHDDNIACMRMSQNRAQWSINPPFNDEDQTVGSTAFKQFQHDDSSHSGQYGTPGARWSVRHAEGQEPSCR